MRFFYVLPLFLGKGGGCKVGRRWGKGGVVEREERKGRNHHRRRGNRSVGSRCSGGKHGCQGLFAVDAGAILCQGHV